MMHDVQMGRQTRKSFSRIREVLDMPDLIGRVREKGGRIGVFPVHRKWIDIGQWGEYKQVLQ